MQVEQLEFPFVIPKPGSKEAVAKGCLCPVIDNNYGLGYCGMPGVYVMSGNCPIHGALDE